MAGIGMASAMAAAKRQRKQHQRISISGEKRNGSGVSWHGSIVINKHGSVTAMKAYVVAKANVTIIND